MKLFILGSLLAWSGGCFAQPKLTTLNKASIPKSISYKGNIVNAVRWTDNSGDHIVITSETGETATPGKGDEDYKDAALYAYCYTILGDSVQLKWKVSDFIRECPVDLKASFIRKSFSVTDLNKDGLGEVWLMYTTSCRGDVSPSDMKIIMYEDNRKYSMRGTNKVQVSEKEFAGGSYTFDQAFSSAPELFRKHALRLWNANILEKWD